MQIDKKEPSPQDNKSFRTGIKLGISLFVVGIILIIFFEMLGIYKYGFACFPPLLIGFSGGDGSGSCSILLNILLIIVKSVPVFLLALLFALGGHIMSLINKIKEQQKPAPIISLIIFSFIFILILIPLLLILISILKGPQP